MKKSEILMDFCLIPALLIVNFCVGGTLPAAVMLAVGIVLIVKGGDVFVDAATWIAEVSGIPKLIVGATVVSIATTLPELLVSAMAAHEGKVDMAIGLCFKIPPHARCCHYHSSSRKLCKSRQG